MNYWLDLFTGTTWNEFRNAGANITGFNERNKNVAHEIQRGDIFLCYLTGVMRWVGALEVIKPTNDTRIIWKDTLFPVRFEVKPLILLNPEQGLPREELEGRVSFFSGPQGRRKFQGFVRGSPRRFNHPEDGELIFNLLQQTQKEPIARPVDSRKLARKPYSLFKAEQRSGKEVIPVEVSIPEPEEPVEQTIIWSEENLPLDDTIKSSTQHTEMQFHLLRLGIDMGLDVWVAKNDRSKAWKGQVLSTLPHMIEELPTQFNEATHRTIELIDVLWLKGNSIVAAFEVECTTSIYSGLLRMSDLVSLQPNLNINLYIVAPDERRDKVQQEILRPTFKLREKPLSHICGFLAFSNLMEKVNGIRSLGIVESIKPDFLEHSAEFFGEDKKDK